MPKLYYTSTSCGAANFITARIGGLNIACEQVTLATHLTDSGANFYDINPKGNVPTVVLDDGAILNENSATLQFLADQDPNHALLPFTGNGRYEVINALGYVNSEYHKAVGPLFNPSLSAEVKNYVLANLAAKLSHLDTVLLAGKEYLAGGRLSIADLYLYICLTWSPYVNADLSPYPNVAAFVQRIGGLPAIQDAHAVMATKPATTNA